MSTPRVFNFAAGPAVLPLPVLEEAQRDLVSMPGVGMSILEMSHRGKFFEGVLQQVDTDIRTLAGVPDDYKVLFLPGGASLQFSMVPLNFLPRDGSADYVVVGRLVPEGREGSEEGRRREDRLDGRGGQLQHRARAGRPRARSQGRLRVVHLERDHPRASSSSTCPTTGSVPLVCDTSSDMFSRPIDVAKHALIYAGAQKNIGPAGVALVIVKDEWLKTRVDDPKLASMLNYAIHAENGSMYNTPPVFAIYIMGLVMKWLLSIGGLPAIHEINERKAGTLYAEIDRTGFYKGHAQKDCRSLMNVTFRLPSEELEATVREGGQGGRSRRPQGAPLGGRHARVHLQRLPGGRRRCARAVHAGVREEERLANWRLVARSSATAIMREAHGNMSSTMERKSAVRRRRGSWHSRSGPRSPSTSSGRRSTTSPGAKRI